MKRLPLLLALFIIVLGASAQKFKPALNLTTGHTYYLNPSVNSEVVQTIGGEKNTVTVGMDFKMAFKVTGTTDSVYNMEVSYLALTMKIDVAGNTVYIDSKKNDPQDLPSSVMAAIMNKPFNLELTRSGRVRSVTNVEKMLSAALNSFPQMDTAKRQQLRSLFLTSLGPDVFKSSIEAGTAIFPSAPVAKDEAWTVNTSAEMPGKLSVTTTYRLTDVVEGLYLIHGEGKLITAKENAPKMLNGMPVQYNLNGSLVSDIRIDKATGWIREVKVKQIMMGDIQILDNPQVPGGMTLPITVSADAVTNGN